VRRSGSHAGAEGAIVKRNGGPTICKRHLSWAVEVLNPIRILFGWQLIEKPGRLPISNHQAKPGKTNAMAAWDRKRSKSRKKDTPSQNHGSRLAHAIMLIEDDYTL